MKILLLDIHYDNEKSDRYISAFFQFISMACVSRVLKDVKALDKLYDFGFNDTELKSIYEARRLTGIAAGCNVTLFSSGKLVIQGKDDAVAHAERIIFGTEGANDNKRFDDSDAVRIGGDECIKGDTFGGLVVCCVKADKTLRRQLFSVGAADSKKIADTKIRKIAPDILRVLGNENVCVIELHPTEYNRLYSQTGSVTRMLNMIYAKAASNLGEPDECVIDQYPGCSVKGCKSVEKGESKYIEIAAASVVARYRGLLQMEELSRKAGFEVPLGSTHVAWALKRLKKEDKDFSSLVKMHFRNVAEFL